MRHQSSCRLPQHGTASSLPIEARPESAQKTAGVQHAGDLGHGSLNVEPVPGRGNKDGIDTGVA
jgi:hypothetical protein